MTTDEALCRVAMRNGSSAVVAVKGDLDVAAAPMVRAFFFELIDDEITTIVLDLDGVDFIDATGLGVLVGVLARCRDAGGRVDVRNLRPNVAKLFEIAGLDDLFRV